MEDTLAAKEGNTFADSCLYRACSAKEHNDIILSKSANAWWLPNGSSPRIN